MKTNKRCPDCGAKNDIHNVNCNTCGKAMIRFFHVIKSERTQCAGPNFSALPRICEREPDAPFVRRGPDPVGY